MSRLVWLLALVAHPGQAYYALPEWRESKYHQPGDLNIGAIFALTELEPHSYCGNITTSYNAISMIEPLVHAINSVNEQGQLLYNLKLGFVVTDSCSKETVALVNAMRFIPQIGYQSKSPSTNKTGKLEVRRDEEEHVGPGDLTVIKDFPVIGVIGTDNAKTSEAISSLLNTFNIPIINFAGCFDVLGTEEFPSFMHLASTFSAQSLAMVRFLVFRGWKYFSVVYEQGMYAEDAFNVIQKSVRAYGLCISNTAMISESSNILRLVKHLTFSPQAPKVVLVFVSSTYTLKIMDAVRKTKTEGWNLWIGTSYWIRYMWSGELVEGSMAVANDFADVPGVKDALMKLTKDNPNPWFLPMLRQKFSCKTDDACIMSALGAYEHGFAHYAGVIHDSVQVLVKATNAFLFSQCHEQQRVTPTWAHDCIEINRGHFLEYIKNVSFEGYSGKVVFDKNGVVHKDLYLYQVIHDRKTSTYTPLKIAEIADRITMLRDISDPHRYMKVIDDVQDMCMPRCDRQEYHLKKLACCWNCKECQSNAYVNENLTACVSCPKFFWPRVQNFNNTSPCIRILTDVLLWHRPVAAFLITLSFIGLAMVLFILVVYWVNAESSVIKSASLEISTIQLVAMFCGYLSVPFLVSFPSELGCFIGVVMILVSLTSMYMTMLLKAVRVYRIFLRRKGNIKVSYTSSKSQVLTFLTFASIEIVVFIIIEMKFPIRVLDFMPEKNVPYVETACLIHEELVAPYFVLDISLLFLCSVLAFKTHSLPSTYKESRNVSMCVITTLIMWVAFLPAHFSTTSHNLKVVLLALSVLMNHSTAIFFLFMPRLLSLKNASTMGFLRRFSADD
ncbi:metabotropic glutamate receptor 8-like [Physella acuta]|uniref:metabotropic glutamate receptor 8-like n=1 Tax=Physella acuta TaxID=109671 RepID=UPI0027DCBEFC|nr:metabotropic glutamate receptor 8-like [Physella acuta]